MDNEKRLLMGGQQMDKRPLWKYSEWGENVYSIGGKRMQVIKVFHFAT
ncbi:MAG: hypothetical protein KC643_26805 [Nitrospira sp.]|nr:hypothetical protein [Nitrospira sp.]